MAKRNSPIASEDELIESLGVREIKDLSNDPITQLRFVQVASRVDLKLLAKVLSSVPELAKAFTHAIKSMENLGKSLEETKRLRWNVLREVAVARELSPDQILEAMRILAEIEQQERVDWTSVFKTVAKVFGALAFVILAIVAAVTGLGRTTQRDET